MTKYESINKKIKALENAMHKATNEACKKMWFLQAERLKYKASQMTIKEAMEVV
jgi:hypothetical protein